MVHSCNGILLSCKKELSNAICSNTNGPRDYHPKSKRERQILYHSYVKSKICHIRTYLQSRNRLTDIENRLVVAKEERDGEEWTERLGLADVNCYI